MTRRAGTSSGRAQSAVLIMVPEAEPLVGRHRALYDPVAAGGVPAHITLMVPWLPPDEINDQDLAELKDCLKSDRQFDFTLSSVGWFERRVMWLRPEPADLFLEMVGQISERFSTPPWSGEFAQVIPHLTVAHTGGRDLGGLAKELEVGLPISCRAREVLVMIGDGARWYKRASFTLGDPTPLGGSSSEGP